MMENIYRNFQSDTAHRQTLLQHLSEGYWGPDPTSAHGHTTSSQKWTERLRVIFVSALQVDKAVFFTAAITVTAFVPLFTMQGVEGQIFGPMARTYGYALAGALLSTFTVTPVLAVPAAAKGNRGDRDQNRACLAVDLYAGASLGAVSRRDCRDGGSGISRPQRACRVAARQRIPAGTGGGQFLDQGGDAVRRCRSMRAPPLQARCGKSCCGIRRSSPWCPSTVVPTMAATPRRFPMSSCLRRSSRSTNGRPISPRKS